MKLTEVVCMCFGHRWWYVGVFTRMCRTCEVVQVANPDDTKFYRNSPFIKLTWRTL